MHRYEELIVALTDGGTHVHHTIGTLSLATTPLFHLDNHLLERVGLLLDLTSTNRRQQEARILIDIGLGSVNFATGLAGKIFLGLSILNSLSSHDSAMDDHVLVYVALAHISN